jgi:hypothetical protein
MFLLTLPCRRTWSTCSITLLDSSSSSPVSMCWMMLDDAVRYSRLLVPGEQIAMYCPTVKSHTEQQLQQQEAQAPQLVLECAESVVLLVQAADGSSPAAPEPGGDTDAAQQSPGSLEQQQQQPQCVDRFDSPAELHAGQQGVVLCGVVADVQRLPSLLGGGPRLGCRLANSPAHAAAGGGVCLQLQFLPHSTSKVSRESWCCRFASCLHLTHTCRISVAGMDIASQHVTRSSCHGAVVDAGAFLSYQLTGSMLHPSSLVCPLAGAAAAA